MLINRMPSRVIHNSTPITRLLDIQPNYTFLHTFGCACWPNLRKYNSHKLQFPSNTCVFLGYNSMHKGYKCLDQSIGRIYISRDMVFDESSFPFSTYSRLTIPSQTTYFPQSKLVILNDHLCKCDLSLLLSN